MRKHDKLAWATLFIAFKLVLANIAAYITHFVEMIPRTFEGDPTTADVVLLISGAILPFIGMFHGWYIWFT